MFFKIIPIWIGKNVANIETFILAFNKVAQFYKKQAVEFYIYRAKIKKLAELNALLDFQYTSCTAQYSPCDTFYNNHMKNITSNHGQVREELKNIMKPNFRVVLFQGISIGDECKIPSLTPHYNKPFIPFNLEGCKSFRHKFSSDTFNDEEDGSKLDYLVTAIDNTHVQESNSWIQINSSSYEFYGIIPDRVYNKIDDTGFNISVRATDKSGKYATGWVIINITYQEINQFYHYEMELMYNEQRGSNHLKDQADFSSMVNNFFDGKSVTNIMSYVEQINGFKIKWSVCTLPNYCSRANIQLVNNKIFTASNQIKPEFKAAFQPIFTIKTAEFVQNPVCQEPLNPPIVSQNPLRFKFHQCGGFEMIISETLFHDSDDGGTRNLRLQLLTRTGEKLSITYSWMAFQFRNPNFNWFPYFISCKRV